MLWCEVFFVNVRGFLGVLSWFVWMLRRIVLLDFCFFILGDGFFVWVFCIFNSILLLEFCCFILGLCLFFMGFWLVFMLRVCMIFGLNLCWFDGELGVIGSNFFIWVDLFLLVGECVIFFWWLLRIFFCRFGELGLEEIIVGLLFVEFICWGSEDVVFFGISFCRVLYKFCILWIEVDIWCCFNIVVVCLGFMFELVEVSVKCFFFGGVVCDWIFEN